MIVVDRNKLGDITDAKIILKFHIIKNKHKKRSIRNKARIKNFQKLSTSDRCFQKVFKIEVIVRNIQAYCI